MRWQCLFDYDDDHPVGELRESDVEMLRRIFPGRRDPRVHEFSDLAHSDQACAERCDDELQDRNLHKLLRDTPQALVLVGNT